MPAPAQLTDLVARFREHLPDYHAGAYNETQLRRDFLDPLFKLLGWDVHNKAGYAEAYREVVHEDKVRVGGMTKAPDYSFRVGGQRKFFLEAKKPSIFIKEDIAPAYQLRRYAWSAGLSLSILSDFEEFAIYDGSVKPDPKDKSSKARIFYCTFEDYADKWDEIAALFSKNAVLKGGIERFVKKLPGRRGTATVDAEFLAQIENWRDLLAKNIALRNDGIEVQALNHAVQATIDRIVFLRICEDRGIEHEARLLALTNGAGIYARLTQLFRDADDRYNSGLFHFRAEKGRAGDPDGYTLKLAIDDKPLRDIIRGLYYPESPYEFAVLPADILGQVYERFLGKVIRLTAGGQAKVEEKPEVKKAGGVYYTPTYIVDYIVRQTVGALLEGKTPKQAEKLRICDPACGSGSFLIGAYQYLLDWHLKWYAENEPQKHASGKSPRLRQSHDGWRLSVAERKRILINSIYGVDIDAQAVEVTKLSLLLKVLEGETGETLGLAQMKLFHERALPNLDANILCGNSLIGTNFYDGRLDLDEGERRRINAFDWETGFPEVFKAGGFDAVIGNPPYGALLGEADATYLRERFVTGKDGLDTYQVFMEQVIRIIADSGKISMIVPSAWYSAPKSSILRRFIASNTDPIAFINLPYDIFTAWVDTTIFVTEKRKRKTDWQRPERHLVTLRTFPKRQQIDSAVLFFENTGQADMKGWFADGNDLYLTYADSTATELLAKILKAGKPLSEFADIQRGVTPFHLLESASHAKAIRAFNGTVRRYVCSLDSPAYIRFDETLAEPKPIRYFQGERLLLRELISRQFRLQATKISTDFVTNKSMQSLLPLPEGPSSNYLLGLINSRLLSWFFLSRSQVGQRDDFPKVVLKETRSLPIRPIDFSDSTDRTRHDKMVKLVESMLTLHEQLAAAKTAHDKTLIQRQIDATDRQIDVLVYELYGLTDEEIRIVEAANAPACAGEEHAGA